MLLAESAIHLTPWNETAEPVTRALSAKEGSPWTSYLVAESRQRVKEMLKGAANTANTPLFTPQAQQGRKYRYKKRTKPQNNRNDPMQFFKWIIESFNDSKHVLAKTNFLLANEKWWLGVENENLAWWVKVVWWDKKSMKQSEEYVDESKSRKQISIWLLMWQSSQSRKQISIRSKLKIKTKISMLYPHQINLHSRIRFSLPTF